MNETTQCSPRYCRICGRAYCRCRFSQWEHNAGVKHALTSPRELTTGVKCIDAREYLSPLFIAILDAATQAKHTVIYLKHRFQGLSGETFDKLPKIFFLRSTALVFDDLHNRTAVVQVSVTFTQKLRLEIRHLIGVCCGKACGRICDLVHHERLVG